MKKTIGEQVAEYMTARNIKAGEMARRAHTSRQNIEGLIKRNRFPREYLSGLAEAMGVSADVLLAGAYVETLIQSSAKDVTEGEQVADTGAKGDQTVPTSMPYSPRNLKSAILLMGSLLGALDARSRSIIGDMLKDLALHSDDAEDIAEKASVLATVQKPISGNRALNKALRGRDAVETAHLPLAR